MSSNCSNYTSYLSLLYYHISLICIENGRMSGELKRVQEQQQVSRGSYNNFFLKRIIFKSKNKSVPGAYKTWIHVCTRHISVTDTCNGVKCCGCWYLCLHLLNCEVLYSKIGEYVVKYSMQVVEESITYIILAQLYCSFLSQFVKGCEIIIYL